MILTSSLLSEAMASLSDHGYALGENIGSGGFGSVYKVKSIRYIQDFCVKILPRIDNHSFPQQTFQAEFECLMRLSHPVIVRLYDVWSAECCNFLILEYISNGSMSNLIENHHRLTDDTIRTFGLQLLSGLVYCHSNNFCHGDIKPANILIDNLGRARLADFGLSGTIAKLTKDLQHPRGSIGYLPPERLMGTGTDPRATDVWALGITFFQMATGNLPWTLTSIEEAIEQIRNGIVIYPPNMSDGLREVLQKMLTVNETDRATMQEMLNMPFFVQAPGILKPIGSLNCRLLSARRRMSAQTVIVPKLTNIGKTLLSGSREVKGGRSPIAIVSPVLSPRSEVRTGE
jgi:serine/threonine protein kinase